MLGGFTGYLGETLKGSASAQAMLSAYESGAVIAGSSAGAMVMCQYYFDPSQRKIIEGLELLPNTCVLPHHNTFGKGWAAQLSQSPTKCRAARHRRTYRYARRWSRRGKSQLARLRARFRYPLHNRVNQQSIILVKSLAIRSNIGKNVYGIIFNDFA